MNRPILIVAVLALVVGACMLLFRTEAATWTTDAPEALAAFEAGLEAQKKLYHEDAQVQFERALELDPDFLVAKALLASVARPRSKRLELATELSTEPLSDLTEREAFLVNYAVLVELGSTQEAKEVVLSYTEAHPEDPFGLSKLADMAFSRGQWDEAAATYKRILKTSPNWVETQNRLGYIALAQGRFAESEELFRTYEFIAPDQANPHDSLGELLTMTGRYREARKHLEQALEIKPDFCSSYDHLVGLAVMMDDLDRGPALIERASAHCSPNFIHYLKCRVELWDIYIEGRFEDAFDPQIASCLEQPGDLTVLSHRLEVSTGRLADALAREQRMMDQWRQLDPQDVTIDAAALRSLVKHLEAVRLASEGQWERAIELFTKADRHFFYWGNGGVMKLYNQLNLAYALTQAGREKEANVMIEKVAAVNPSFAEDFDSMHFPSPTSQD